MASPPPPFFTLRPHTGTITCVQYVCIDDKSLILSGTSSGELAIWDLALKRQCWTQKCQNDLLSVACTISIEKKFVLSLQKGGEVKSWDIEKNEVDICFTTPNPGFCGFSLLPDNTGIALADKDFGKINIFNCSSGKLQTELKYLEPQSRGMCLCTFSFEDRTTRVLGGFEDGSVAVWDIRYPDKELSFLKLYSEPTMCLDYNTNMRHGVCGSPLNTLETFTLTEQFILEKSYSVPLRNSGVSTVKIRHDRRILASGGWDGRIRIFGCKKGKPLAALNFHTDAVQSMCFASDKAQEHYSNLLICGSKDQRISLWKIY